jgi:rod shape-determining protein MreB and related proteins
MFGLFKNTIYVRIKPDFISTFHVQSGVEFSDIPAIAIEKNGRKSSIIAVGLQATKLSDNPNVMVTNGFKHPRTLLADFTIAERTLRYFLVKVRPKSFFTPAPVLIIHPQAVLEGGLTQIEIRAFGELGAMIGSRQVYVWEGTELTTKELLNLSFPSDKGSLLFP